jgi:predicted anti-sigma-YlaC factor YlaD
MTRKTRKNQTGCPGHQETGISVEISCEEVWRALGGYLESDIDADLRRRMQEHFKQCNHCRAVLDGANNLIQLVGDGRAFDVPTGFSSRLYRKLEEHLAQSRRK